MDPQVELVVQVLVLATMVVGLLGLVVPIFPGLLVMWLATLVYGLMVGFNLTSGILFAIISILALVGSVVDNVFMGAMVIKKGGSGWTLVIASVAGLVFSVLLPPIGGLVGSLGAALLYEYYRLKDWPKAIELTKGMALGCGGAFFVRFGLGVVMIGLWLVWAFAVQS